MDEVDAVNELRSFVEEELGDAEAVYLLALTNFQNEDIKRYLNDPTDPVNPKKLQKFREAFFKQQNDFREKCDMATAMANDLKIEITDPAHLREVDEIMAVVRYPTDNIDDELDESESSEIISSDSADDGTDETLNESRTEYMHRAEEVAELMRTFNEIIGEIQTQEDEKEMHKQEMFQAKDRNEDLSKFKDYQNFLFNELNELKKELIDRGNEIKKMLGQLMRKTRNDQELQNFNQMIQQIDEQCGQFMPISPQRENLSRISPRQILTSLQREDVPRISPRQILTSPQREDLSRISPRRTPTSPRQSPGTSQRVSPRVQIQTDNIEISSESDDDDVVIVEQSPQKAPSPKKALPSRPISKLPLRRGIPVPKVPALAKIHPILGGIQKPTMSRLQVPQPTKYWVPPLSQAQPEGQSPRRIPTRTQTGIPQAGGRQISTRTQTGIPSRPMTASPATPRRSTNVPQNIAVDQESRALITEILKKNLTEIISSAQEMSIEDREKAEKKDIRLLISGIINNSTFFKDFETAPNQVEKLKIVEEKLKKIFDMTKAIMTAYRGGNFQIPQADRENIDRFIKEVIASLNALMNFNQTAPLRQFLNNALLPQKVPYVKFALSERPRMVITPPTPSSRAIRSLRAPSGFQKSPLVGAFSPSVLSTSARINMRPSSTPLNISKPKVVLPSRTGSIVRRKSLSRVGSGSRVNPPSYQERLSSVGTSTKTKVQKQVRDLSSRSLQKSYSEPSTRQKLDNFLNSFCKVFIMNQRNRKAPFKVWIELFQKHTVSILNDMDKFYKSLPLPEFQKFNRASLQKSLNKLLEFVYKETKDKDISKGNCKDLIGDEMNKLIECKHLKDLSSAMVVFVEGAKELLRPHLNRMDKERMSSTLPTTRSSSMRQPSRVTAKIDRSMVVPKVQPVIEKKLELKTHLQRRLDDLKAQYENDLMKLELRLDAATTDMQRENLEGKKDRLKEKFEIHSGLLTKREKDNAAAYSNSQFWKYFDSTKLWNQFRLIIGQPKELEDINPTNKMIKAIKFLLEHSLRIDKALKNLAMNRREEHYNNVLKAAIGDLREQIILTIYNNDSDTYYEQVNEVNNFVAYRFNVEELLEGLEDRIFSEIEVDLIIEEPFDYEADDTDEDDLEMFVQYLREFQSKYIWEVLKGNMKGSAERYTTRPISWYDSKEYEEQELVATILNRIRINHPTVVAKYFSPDTPFPETVLEKDILYVACQLTNRDDNSGEDKLEKLVLDVARRYQTRSITERVALRAITGIINTITCIPIEFHNKYFYHKDNMYFDQIYFEDEDLNMLVRSRALKLRNKQKCHHDEMDEYGSRSQRRIFINPDISSFMHTYDNDIEEYLAVLEGESFQESYCVTMLGAEIARNGNGVLGIPEKVNSNALTDGKMHDIRVNPGALQFPLTEAEQRQHFLNQFDNLEGEVDRMYGDTSFLQNSTMAHRCIIYQLQPRAFKRQNLWQPRGAELPTWFPGMFTVFPDSIRSIPTNTNLSINELLTHAWRSMAPKYRGG